MADGEVALTLLMLFSPDRHTLKGGDQMAVFDRYLDEGHAMKLRQFALHNLTFAYALSQAGTGNITWRSGE